MISLKQVVLKTGFHAGLFRLIQFARRDEATILTFHRFRSNGEGDSRGMDVRWFADCMAYLAEAYVVLPLPDLVAALRRGKPHRNAVAVTFDDGYHDVVSLAVPVLRRYSIPASLFVVSDFVDGKLWLWPDRLRFIVDRVRLGTTEFRHSGTTRRLMVTSEADRPVQEAQWCEHVKWLSVPAREELLTAMADACGVSVPAAPPPECRAATWADLRALAAEGFDIGAHSRTHPILSRIPQKQLDDEIAWCKEQIEGHLGSRIRHFSYPNGQPDDYTPEAIRTVVRAGYQAAVTTIRGGNTPATPIFELRRINVRTDSRAEFAQCVSGFELMKDTFRGRVSDGRELRRPIP